VNRLVADGHVHLYPFYDLARAAASLRENLARLGAPGTPAGFLAERHDCHLFRDLAEGRVAIPGAACRPAGRGALAFGDGASPGLLLFAGRQVVTAERLEVLVLTADLAIDDGLPAAEVIRRARDAGAVPVLAWAPGKWFFARGAVVRRLLDTFAAGELLLGDTTLRPTVWPEPRLMRVGRRLGFGILAGSDPLPFAGEEGVLGRYATALEGEFDVADPVPGVRRALASTGGVGVALGRRSGPAEALRRLRRNSAARRSAGG
jgi:hypothetical protein